MILGLDFDTRAVHAVLLDDDTNQARYVPVPFSDRRKSEAFRLEDARNVSRAFKRDLCRMTHTDGRWSHAMDDVWLVGIEKPYAQGRGTAYSYGLVTGAILSCIPAGVCVVLVPPQEWKAQTVGKANASKDDVRAWALHNGDLASIGGEPHWNGYGWPQDAFDAYCVARAVRELNAQGIAAA